MALSLLMTGWGCRKGIPLGEPDYYSCLKDEECVSVPVGCCGCAMGGQNTAINRRHQAGWEAHRRRDCGKIMCPAVYLCGPEKPLCINRRCRMSS